MSDDVIKSAFARKLLEYADQDRRDADYWEFIGERERAVGYRVRADLFTDMAVA